MPTITLPDGSQKEFAEAVTVQQVAESIGSGLAKAAVAGNVDGHLRDTSHVINEDTALSIVTGKDKEGLEVIRHSTAHLLAQAVKQIFPTAQVTIGPVIENGFYYDFAFARPFTPEDLEKIEGRMRKLAKQGFGVTRHVMGRDEAMKFFRDMGEEYKAKIIEDIPKDEELTVYQQGDFYDLCRGPHVPSTSMLKAFKLTKLAGAYWRGDSKNEMLQRVYGTAWATKKELDDYLHRLEEAEKRDHRKLDKAMDLFHMQEEAPGMVFWHPRGWTIYQIIENYIRDLLAGHGYTEVSTPQLVDLSLWKASGHWDNFREEMFTTQADEHRLYAIKPMSCPCHVQIFNQGIKSYRDLPVRLAEFGNVHRNEPSGTLHGLMRARNFVQDDGHIFCTEEQIQEEAASFINQVFTVYKDFGFDDIILKLSTRPDHRVGADEVWDIAEKALAQALESERLQYEVCPGEGAFYGPKIEFALRDCIGRVWQCGTLQVDFSQPERLNAHYIAEDGAKRTPVMLHRAILGSLERFMGIVLEHHAGVLPLWLAPVQAVVMNITQEQEDYAKNLTSNLHVQGIRAISDLRNEKIGFKIREHTLARVPYLIVVGNREVDSQAASVRTQAGEDLGSMSVTDLSQKLLAEIKEGALAVTK